MNTSIDLGKCYVQFIAPVVARICPISWRQSQNEVDQHNRVWTCHRKLLFGSYFSQNRSFFTSFLSVQQSVSHQQAILDEQRGTDVYTYGETPLTALDYISSNATCP